MDLKAVIFDYGMVLSAPADPMAHDELVALTGLPLEVFEKHYWANRDLYDIGEVTGVQYWEKIARDAATEFSPETVVKLVETDTRMWMSLNDAMVAWALQVKEAGFHTGILSNIGEALVPVMLEKFAWLGEFTHLTWSYQLRLVKPEPEIYIKTLEGLGVEPREALFIDDKAVNIRAAESVGMHGIVFTDLPSLVRELKDRGFPASLPLELETPA